MLLPIIPLPLSPNGPPSEYDWDDRPLSQSSNTTAFIAGIYGRDVFLDTPRCVICGDDSPIVLEHCHISMASERDAWDGLKARKWIPSEAKQDPNHEPRNGLLMCATHRQSFDNYDFFIRYVRPSRKFVFVNYSGRTYLEQFDGKAIALQSDGCYAPFPPLFVIHEMRVRGFHPFQPTSLYVADNPPWQQWILSDGVFDEARHEFVRHGNDIPGQLQPRYQARTTGTAAKSGQAGESTLAPLDADTIDDILAATRAMPSWRACQMEGTNWGGTAEENIQTYISSIGVQEQQV